MILREKEKKREVHKERENGNRREERERKQRNGDFSEKKIGKRRPSPKDIGESHKRRKLGILRRPKTTKEGKCIKGKRRVRKIRQIEKPREKKQMAREGREKGR